eukprot:CAMPEP_0170601818 /NCGR_PEP_ID=MMETSP0224-20130122/18060_1 /TAXON_ID=285029 /ORGANISM="Togula jolla, Strain CCCM 725" /LENGTH=271 /DNA_ID=CAMNT_0010926615 /DNA_START=84 /DNA_END=899 /DNA_ORIENTATION=-
MAASAKVFLVITAVCASLSAGASVVHRDREASDFLAKKSTAPAPALGAAAAPEGLDSALPAVPQRSFSLAGGERAAALPLLMAVDGMRALAKRAHLREGDGAVAEALAVLGTFAIWVCLVLVVAVLYQKHRASLPVDLKQAQAKTKEEGFKHGAFSCLEEPKVFAWSFFCGPVRWADNMQAVGLLAYWLAIAAYLAVAFGDLITGGVIGWALVTAFFTYFRQALRKKFGLETSKEIILKDFGLWCCCAPCAITQETRHIEAAPKGAKADLA